MDSFGQKRDTLVERAPDYESCLQKIRSKWGDNFEVVFRRTVTWGGFLGFFEKQGVELDYVLKKKVQFKDDASRKDCSAVRDTLVERAPDYETCLQKIRAKWDHSFEVTFRRTVNWGGFLGFFEKQGVELEYVPKKKVQSKDDASRKDCSTVRDTLVERAPDYETCLKKIRAKWDNSFEVTFRRTVNWGGFLGFFEKHGVELEYVLKKTESLGEIKVG